MNGMSEIKPMANVVIWEEERDLTALSRFLA